MFQSSTHPFPRALVVVVVGGALGVVDVGEDGRAGLVDAHQVVSARRAVAHQPQRSDLRVLREAGRGSGIVTERRYYYGKRLGSFSNNSTYIFLIKCAFSNKGLEPHLCCYTGAAGNLFHASRDSRTRN